MRPLAGLSIGPLKSAAWLVNVVSAMQKSVAKPVNIVFMLSGWVWLLSVWWVNAA